MSIIGLILIIVLIAALFGAIPSWPYARSWGYGPTGLLALILIIVLVLIFTHRI